MREVLSVISRLANDKRLPTPYIVGGLPRDKVMGKIENIDDVDITTGSDKSNYLSKLVYYYISKSFPDASFKEMDDGHSTVHVNNIKLDFSSNFISPQVDVALKKAGIANPTSLQKEMFSRDFTCNTLLMTMDLKKVLDPTTMGIQDIKNKIIRTPLPPEITLGNDNKRIVRIIYLAAKLDFDVEPEIIEWVRKNNTAINNCKEKYIKDKLSKAAEYNIDKTVDLLTRMNLINITPLPDEVLLKIRRGTSDLAGIFLKLAKKSKKDKKRVDLDTRPTQTYMWFKNFDYTDEGPNETSLGGGLYHGNMSRYKSVEDFRKQWRAKMKKRKKDMDAKNAQYKDILVKKSQEKRILVLDDDKSRHNSFDEVLKGQQITHVYNYADAIKELENGVFDEVYLDHDLGDFGESPTGYGQTERTGADVANYIARVLPEEKRPKLVHIHSWNPVGAHNIALSLQSVEIPYVREPFGDPYSEEDVVLWVQRPETGEWVLSSELNSGIAEAVENHERAGYRVKVLPFGEDPNDKES